MCKYIKNDFTTFCKLWQTTIPLYLVFECGIAYLRVIVVVDFDGVGWLFWQKQPVETMETSTNPKVKQILNFMFPHSMAESMNLWFGKSPKTDDYIRDTFGKDVIDAGNGKYDHWINNPIECLALIILLDQFSRNIYRHQVYVYFPYIFTF